MACSDCKVDLRGTLGEPNFEVHVTMCPVHRAAPDLLAAARRMTDAITDGGKSFTNYAWATEAFNPGGIFMGDYTGIAAFGGKVYGVWTEKPAGSNGSGGTASPSTHPGTVIKIGSADFK